MAYSSGFLKDTIKVLAKLPAEDGEFGRGSGGMRYTLLGTFHANVAWAKGVKPLREGAVDAYDTVMVRMRYRSTIDHDCLILHHGKVYAIQTLHGDYQTNELQMTCQQQPEGTEYYSRLLVTADGDALASNEPSRLMTTERGRTV